MSHHSWRRPPTCASSCYSHPATINLLPSSCSIDLLGTGLSHCTVLVLVFVENCCCPHLHSFLTICVGPLWMKHWRGCAQIGLCWIWSTRIEDHNLVRAHDGVDMQNHSDGYTGQVETPIMPANAEPFVLQKSGEEYNGCKFGLQSKIWTPPTKRWPNFFGIFQLASRA